jgi:hypothetical protein
MGITKNCVKFLTYAKSLGVNFDNTLMLGRQQLFVSADEINRIQHQFGFAAGFSADPKFAEPLFQLLGSTKTDSLDYSDFEQATIIHNLNQPLSEKFHGRYTTVFDGGTLEHVFNFPVALKCCMDALAVGGHFLAITPANNQCGHGFYQFSPELFHSVFSGANGFRTKLVAIAVEQPATGINDWFEVSNPREIKKRVMLSNEFPTYLMVIAEKISNPPDVFVEPFQSDYQYIWEVFDSMQYDKPRLNEGRTVQLYRKWVPASIKRIIRKIAGRENSPTKEIKGLGHVNEAYFKKIPLPQE